VNDIAATFGNETMPSGVAEVNANVNDVFGNFSKMSLSSNQAGPLSFGPLVR
jgi:hypothetical protein